MKNKADIILSGLELSVNLGWPKGERLKQQIVRVDVTLSFAEPPLACRTDQLKDTLCYDSLISKIKAYVADRNFRLIEHLGYGIHDAIRQNVSADMRVKVSVTKKPLIENLLGGVTFCYGDGE